MKSSTLRARPRKAGRMILRSVFNHKHVRRTPHCKPVPAATPPEPSLDRSVDDAAPNHDEPLLVAAGQM